MQRAAHFMQTYGSLIYKQLGPGAEEKFSSQWGVGYAMDSCTEWQEVAKTAVKAALILVRAVTERCARAVSVSRRHLQVVLDLLRITRDRPWFEQHGAFSGVGRKLLCDLPLTCTLPPLTCSGFRERASHAVQLPSTQLVAADESAGALSVEAVGRIEHVVWARGSEGQPSSASERSSRSRAHDLGREM
jgi:hypothetical protein